LFFFAFVGDQVSKNFADAASFPVVAFFDFKPTSFCVHTNSKFEGKPTKPLIDFRLSGENKQSSANQFTPT
jgi:hypothetical protein